MQGAEARELLRQAIRTDGSKPFNRSRLMFVGEGRSGKTSTVRSLLGQLFDPDQASTVGAETKTCMIERREHVRRWQEAQSHEKHYDRALAEHVAMQLKSRATDGNGEEKKNGVTSASPVKADAHQQDIAEHAASPLPNSGAIDVKDEEESSGVTTSSPPVKDDDVSPSPISASPLSATTPDEEPRETKLIRDAGPRLTAESEASERDAEVVARFDEEMVASLMLSETSERDAEVVARFDEEMVASLMLHGEPLTFSIWDYGGQRVFRAFLHVFFSRFGVYACVFSMERMLADDDGDARVETLCELRSWFSNIRLHAHGAPCVKQIVTKWLLMFVITC